MIRFIDLATGNVFDGSQPYVFWFEEEQSTNLLYIRKICILSNKSSIKCTIENNDVFQLIDVNKIANVKDITVNYKSYKDIQEMISISYQSQGTPYKDFYVHMVYVLGHSASAGEYQCEATIDDTKISIGADFYNENETLGINVSNMGLDIPKDVQRAIYESNLREDGVDNILLNRKFKELLIQYMDIIANKGSYNSLLNSLSWFEYGDLVKIYDYWKHGEVDRELMYHEDLKQIVDNKIQEMLSTFQKTTYIGLYYGLQSIRKDSNGDIVYRDKNYFVKGDEDNDWLPARTQLNLSKDKDYILQIGEGDISVEEGNDGKNDSAKFIPLKAEDDNTLPEPLPELIPTTSLWSTVDLSLKMALLGNFFSTYFMPIHLDLLHSTIESIVYSDTIKILPWVVNNRFDNFDSIQAFECSLKNGDTYYLNDVRCRVYPNTPFGAELEDVREEIPGQSIECAEKTVKKLDDSAEHTEDKHGNIWHQAYKEKEFDIFGVETEDRAWSSKDKEGNAPTNDDQILFDAQYFNGVGAIIPINCTFKGVQIGCPFVEASILVYHNGDSHIHQTTRLYNDRDEMNTYTRTMNFSVLLQDVGNYVFVISFKTSDSKEFMRTFRFRVDDDIYQNVKPYLIKKKDYWKILDEFGSNNFSILQASETDPTIDYTLGDYMYSLIRQDGTPNPHYRQFLATSVNSFIDNISTNTCILYQPKYTLGKNGTKTIVSKLYYYFKITKNTDINPTKTINKEINGTSASEVQSATNDIISELQNFLPSYIWIVQERYIDFNGEVKIPYILGINREFTTDDEIVMLDKKNIGIIRDGKDMTLDLKMTINSRTLKPTFKCNHEKYVYIKLGKISSAETVSPAPGIVAMKAKSRKAISTQSIADVPFAINDFIKQDEVAPQATMKTQYEWDWYDLTTFRKSWFVDKRKIKLSDGTTRDETDAEQIKRKEPSNLALIDNRVIHLKIDTKEGVEQYIDVDLSNLWRIDPSSPYDSDGNPKKFVLNARQTMYRDPVVAVSCYDIKDGLNGKVNKTKYGEIWKREFFVPFFYELKEVEDNTIRQDQVLCFFPDLTKIKGKNISDIGWKIINDTYDKVIIPKAAEGFNIYPIDPMLGRYDYRILIDKGYYNLELKYELVDNADHNHIYKSNSQFVVV